MKCTVATTHAIRHLSTGRALAVEVERGLAGERVDLCMIFASAHYEDELATIADEFMQQVSPRVLLGVTGEGVISGSTEYESQPVLTAFGASLPGVKLRSFHLLNEDLARLQTPEALHEELEVSPTEQPHFLLFADPFSIPIYDVIAAFNGAYEGRPMAGGLASAGEAPQQNVLIFDGVAMRSGMVGVALSGNIDISYVVSQGCRPIGDHMVITRADRNIIYQLGGRTPLAVVNEMLLQISPRDKELLRRRGLLVGRVINEYQKDFSRGDFLIRNPRGFDEKSGAMAVDDFVRTGQTVQFHVRDGDTAAEDLESLLAPAGRPSPAGVLLFSCNGRGTRLFTHKNHDARAVAGACGGPPTAGFFCAGEIGPVGARNFLHGHTASIALLRPGVEKTSGGEGETMSA